MNNLNNIGGGDTPPIAGLPEAAKTKESSTSGSLPLALYKTALNFVEGREVDIKTLESKERNYTEVTKRESALIDDVINFIQQNIPYGLSDAQKTALRGLNAEKKILGCINLNDIKNSFLTLKSSLVDILRNQKSEDLDQLEKVAEQQNKPRFFKELFGEAKVSKGLAEAATKDKAFEKASIYFRMTPALVEMNSLPKIFEINNLMPDPFDKVGFLGGIYVDLYEKEETDKASAVLNEAIKIAESVTDPDTKSQLLKSIAFTLSFTGQHTLADPVINKIPDPGLRQSVRQLVIPQ